MNTDGIYQWITGIVVLFGALGSLYTLNRSARRDSVDDLHRLIDRLEKRIDEQDKKIQALEAEADERDKRILELERENRVLEDWSRRLIAQLVDAGITPVHSMRTNE